MRRSFWIVACVLAVAAVPAGARDGIQWTASLDSARTQAARENKPIMIGFYADWCGWCRKLDNEVYTDSGVVERARSFVSLRLNAEKEGARLAGALRVEGMPGIVFFSSTGREIHRIPGYLPAAAFRGEMDKALARATAPGRVADKTPVRTVRSADERAPARKPDITHDRREVVKTQGGSVRITRDAKAGGAAKSPTKSPATTTTRPVEGQDYLIVN